jgi:hypothetical protein
MKSIKILQLIIFLAIIFSVSQTAKAQYAYGLSDIVYDNTTKKVTSFSGTALDFYAGLHYDPAVVGGVFQERSLLGYDSATGYADIFDAIVRLRTTFPAPPDTRYDVLSDHYIAAYFYTDIIIFDEDGTPLPGLRWYDPLGFSRYGGGGETGWSSFRGSDKLSTFYDVQYFYLGTTGKGVI